MSKDVSIPAIPKCDLPLQLPRPEEIKNMGGNAADYDPIVWGMEYFRYRKPLAGLTDDQITARHNAIMRNMRTLTSANRDMIPIQFPQSSWYWFKKEYQTRLAAAWRTPRLDLAPFARPDRGILPTPPALSKRGKDNGIAFRYSKLSHNRELMDGCIRFTPAQNYDDPIHDEERRDDELTKRSYMSRFSAKITTLDGKEIKPLSDITRANSGPGYHILCTSTIWEDDLFGAFGETCVVILDVNEFRSRIKTAIQRHPFRRWVFTDNPVHYFDPYFLQPNERVDWAMSKDFKYAHQFEYRFTFAQVRAATISDVQYLDIGPAHDITKLYDRNGNEVR